MYIFNTGVAVALVVVTFFIGVRVHAVRTRATVDDGRVSRYVYPAAFAFCAVALWNDPLFEPAWLQLLPFVVAPFIAGFVVRLVLVKAESHRATPPPSARSGGDPHSGG
ncbi:hypothetical protein [Microbacterium sp. NPDC087665]|uniref:hypothetical protein n=1 Tax=Microbacterium sp. NPDC087665 TaxID=3364194 RepID=UPI00381EE412